MIITLPVPIRDVTHLQIARVIIDPDSGVIVHMNPGALDALGAFVPDRDFPQPTVRTVAGDEYAQFCAWSASARGSIVDDAYGTLFNVMDVMAWVGHREYAERGIKTP